jgi:adenosylcobinamide-phosphate synthase
VDRGALIVLGAAAVDGLLGEPPNLLHPVVWMGNFYRWLRKRAPRDPASAFVWGAIMALSGPLLFGGGAFLLLRACDGILRLLLAIVLLKSALAARALGRAAEVVAEALSKDDLAGAREGLRSLVSRDTSQLSAPLLAAAAIESVAENASDSVVAPLLYCALGGVPAALAYRATNTLDAMIGYHGETEWLGKAAARLDDLANLIPARVTALLLVIAAALSGASPKNALRIWFRDAHQTESPNAGRPMAAMAGALGLQLEKVDHYRLGDAGVTPGAAEISRAVRILYVISAMAFALAALVMRG